MFFSDLPADVFRSIYLTLPGPDRLSLLLACRCMRSVVASAGDAGSTSTSTDAGSCTNAASGLAELRRIVAVALLEMRIADPFASRWSLNITARFPRAPTLCELERALPCDPILSTSAPGGRFRLVLSKPPTAVRLPWFAQRPARPINDLYSPDDEREVMCVDGVMTVLWTAMCCCIPLLYLVPMCLVDTRCFTNDPMWHIRFTVGDTLGVWL
jgi:hypothetical protein